MERVAKKKPITERLITERLITERFVIESFVTESHGILFILGIKARMHTSRKFHTTHYLAPPPLWYSGMSALLGDARTKWARNQLTRNVYVEVIALKRQ
jgi:hypothetical protein